MCSSLVVTQVVGVGPGGLSEATGAGVPEQPSSGRRERATAREVRKEGMAAI